MFIQNPDLRNFLTGALGYLGGIAGGFLFILLVARLGVVRFYNGKVHAKSMLIDDQLLIIGSQNTHYSAWGEGGLNEYSLATDSPVATAEYKALFETKWQQSTPFEEAEYATSP
jgi:phosphatidylserine/phosphatidylglycerophosphate/cardiolipin synthase-like enzyme